MDINDLLCSLIGYARRKHITDLDDDRIGKLLNLFSIYDISCQFCFKDSYDHFMSEILDYAFQKGLIEMNTIDERDAFEAKIMDTLMPKPEDIKTKFSHLSNINPKLATSYLYRLSVDVNYIKMSRLKKNISWVYDSKYGFLELTINLAKPEKDPKDIAKSLNKKNEDYSQIDMPKCVICKENERNYYNARMNLRIVPIILGEELWHMQYSPYQYYDEHAIILHDEHRPMKICKKTFRYLLDFVDQFPEYFIGSNADLPIVGGSILNHDHFQAGKHIFPIEKTKTLKVKQVKDTKIEYIDWPLTTLKLTSEYRDQIEEIASSILNKWKNYDNESLEIISKTNLGNHQTITPIVRKESSNYICYIILRNNRTNEMYPDGIFHPHQDVHHIKKENIGLIEAMGLAILPGRLKMESEMIIQIINHHVEVNQHVKKHMHWMNYLKSNYQTVDHMIIQKEIGIKFEKVLENAGVLKLDQNGFHAMNDFLDDLI